MISTVYFADFKATSRENVPDKIQRLIEAAGIMDILSKDDLTAVKIHFGERGNVAFIRPPYINRIIKAVRKNKAIPFLTDANTLYAGTRSNSPSHIKTAIENGFAYSSMDSTPIIIADGLRGKSEIAVEVNQKHCKEVYIGSEIVSADALISVAHVKGHELSGFGGTLKNLGMGCASRKGKLDQHSNVSPKVKKKTCIGCGNCAEHCPGNAISLDFADSSSEDSSLTTILVHPTDQDSKKNRR
ncbi:Fe-S center protein [Candidatus Magnetoovum chiemensis]|nr:Fe-S center protein [Candidatus Magnetoovum chiemensis]